MKVHVHTPTYFPRLVGMSYAADVRARLLCQLGADVTLVAPNCGKEGAQAPRLYRRVEIELRGNGLPWSPIAGDIGGLVEFTRREAPDIVISEGWFTPVTSLLPQLKGAARHLVLSSHGSAEIEFSPFRPQELFRSLAYRWRERCDLPPILSSLSAAIVLSDFADTNRFRDGGWFRSYGIPVITMANPSIYRPAAMPRELPNRGARLLHIGEMSPNKNQMAAVTALRLLPEDVHLVMAYPAENAYSAEVRRQIDRAGLAHRCHFVVGRPRHELEGLYEDGDLLLITSGTEAQPITVSDALAKAVPFVSTPVGCMSALRGGEIAASGQLADAIRGILADRSRYAALSREGLDYYTQVMGQERSLASLRTLLDTLA